jgi:hypothetical protein
VATVTYKNQPAIDRTKGNVPLAGTSHIYRVKKRLWNDNIESVFARAVYREYAARLLREKRARGRAD